MQLLKLSLLSLYLLTISAYSGNLQYYKASSAKLAELPAGTNQVVFLGSSMTEWWSPFFPGKPYVNRGIAGQTTRQFLLRFQQDVVSLKPKIVVIYGGSNDLAGNTGKETLTEIEGNFKKLHDLAKDAKIKVVQASLTPVCGDKVAGRPPKSILALNSYLNSTCVNSDNCWYADFHSALVNKKGLIDEDLTKDCMHPNTKGYAIMNPIVEKQIAKALAYEVKDQPASKSSCQIIGQNVTSSMNSTSK